MNQLNALSNRVEYYGIRVEAWFARFPRKYRASLPFAGATARSRSALPLALRLGRDRRGSAPDRDRTITRLSHQAPSQSECRARYQKSLPSAEDEKSMMDKRFLQEPGSIPQLCRRFCRRDKPTLA